MEPRVLYEDADVLVIDKPAGMVVNRAESVKGKTVQDWVEAHLNWTSPVAGSSHPTSSVRVLSDLAGARWDPLHPHHPSSDFEGRSGTVHRIDKETSGALIIAKTSEAFEELQRQFKEREIEKKYTALVHGKVTPEKGEITATVGRLPWNRERFGVLPGGREAETRYRAISNFHPPAGGPISNENLSLVELFPKTGRTHQIRVHLKSINHPIVSDEFYAGRKTARRDRKWCPRLFLHASYISFTHPKTGERMGVESELSRDLVEVLGKLS